MSEHAFDVEKPVISIVLPTFNRADYLARAIESCLAQTYIQWELIIVDDASTDATPAVIASYMSQDPRIQMVRHAVNAQLPRSLNTGFARARGTYLTWTSDDDLFKDQALARMLQSLEDDPHTDFVYTDYDVIDADDGVMAVQRVPEPEDLYRGTERIACFLFRRTIYDALGGYGEDFFLAEDYEYILRILAASYTLHPLHDNLYAYRRHANSLTDRYRERALAAAESALRRTYLPSVRGRQQRAAVYMQLASVARWQRRHGHALRYLVRGGLTAPTVMRAKVWVFARKRLKA